MTTIDSFSDLRIGRQQTLRHQVVEALRNAILDCRFKPGDRLVERKLCELTGVSRTSVREALRHLESEGLVRNTPNKGQTVADVTAAEAGEIYEVRRALEGLAGELFTRRAGASQVRALKDALGRMRAAFAAGVTRDIRNETTHFYEVLLTGCGNAVIAGMLRSLNARVMFLRATSMSQKGRGPHSLAEMRRIVDAIASGDPAAARRACEDHVDQARDAALEVLTNRAEPSPRAARRRPATAAS
jgi:DNA-binding GntR family transcriptional regulator